MDHFEKYDIEYNGDTASNHGIFLYDYAQFSGAKKSYQTIAVSGGLGELVGGDDYKSNLSIQCTFGIISKQFMLCVGEIKRWLRGTGRLILSDHRDVFYKVWKIDYGDIEREAWRFGRFTATFVCTPFQFLQDGQYQVENVSYNAGDIARPIYTISGNGGFSLEVNGKALTGTVNGSLTIDTERMLAYNGEGINQSNLLNGDYEDLYLPHGDVVISLTQGMSLSIIPQWGYDI